jgi:hypothetical protein
LRRCRLVIALISTAVACSEAPATGQFGPYPPNPKRMTLADGDTLDVYRVKCWSFTDGSPTALQLEFEAPMPISDTAALRALAYRVWPAFVPYAEELHLTAAIVTGTNLRGKRDGTLRAWRAHHFGFIADRDSAGGWHMRGHPEPLPPAEASGPPRIREATGEPFLASSFPSGTCAPAAERRSH